MKKHLLLLPPLLLASSCGSKKEKQIMESTESATTVYPIHIPFEAGMETEREVKLSDIADSVSYVRLETNDKCLMRTLMGNNLIRTSRYFILPWLDKLFQYTTDGKFVRTIGGKGQGPGEFNYIQQVDVNEKAGEIYMLTTSQKVNVYNLETGRFLYDVKVPHLESAAMVMYGDSTIVTFVDNGNGREKTQLYLTTLKGDTVKLYPRYEEFEVKNGWSYSFGGTEDRYLFKYDGMVCLKDYSNDTLYTVTPESMEKRYVFDLGKYHLPFEYSYPALNGDENKYNELAAPYIRYAVLETTHYLFFPYTHWAGKERSKPKLAMYDKKSGECFRVKDNIIKDDLTNGMYVYYPHGSFDENTLVIAHQAEHIYRYAEEVPENKILEHPQLKGLREDDNPVLMIVHLKK